MDPRETETLIQRLVHNPHDEDALARAHHAGAQDPRAYALLLERVGQATTDPAYAAHWLSEAANVWSMTVGDLHQAARTLMVAIDKDPSSTAASDRLAQLYRDKGDQRALAALLERLVKSLGPQIPQRPELKASVIGMHEELGKLWVDPPLSKPERAIENWKKIVELDRSNVFAIYQTRELLKAQEQFVDAVPFFALEQAQVDDPERKLALYRDESAVRTRAGDTRGACEALRSARALRPDDYGLVQELGAAIVGRIEANEKVAAEEREEARGLLLSLAEAYDGEYGFAYAISALKAAPGDDRAMQLASHYGKAIGKDAELSAPYAAYLAANPGGYMAGEARAAVGSRPPPPPPKASPAPQGAPGVDPRSSRGSMPGAQPISGAAPTSSPRDVPPAAPSASELLEEVQDDEEEQAAAAPPPANPNEVRSLLDQAQAEAQKGRKPTALQKFREALKLDPANSEALTWVEEHLRQKRMYADLKEVLLAAARVTTQPVETRKAQLRDVAGLCESQLRDLDTAISAAKQVVQLDRGDDAAREQLRRLLEKGSRWDDLASVLEQEAMGAPDVETKIALEKKLATLHEGKRKDGGAAAEAWARIAALSPGDEAAIQTAVKLFEKAEMFDQAAQVLSENVSGIEDKITRAGLLARLGELKGKAGDLGAAGDAYAEAADAYGPDGGSQTAKLWAQAEKAYTDSERFTEAANAVEQRANLADGKEKAGLLALAASLFERTGDPATAIEKLEQSAELDPTNADTTAKLEDLYRKADRLADLATFLIELASKLQDKTARTATRFKTAEVQRGLGDAEGARETLLLVLNDGEDERALRELITDAEERKEFQEQADLLRRLGAVVGDKAEKQALATREASLYANEIDDPQGAIERFEAILQSFGNDRLIVHQIASLHEKLGNDRGQAEALERELTLLSSPPAPGGLAPEGSGDEGSSERVEIAQKLAQLYEGPLDDTKSAVRALEIVHKADPEDFDAVARLLKLSEQIEDWDRVAVLLAMLIEVEGDENEASEMSRKLAKIQQERLLKGDEALATLEKLADQGDKACQEAYVALGDELGWQGIVATKLVMWNEGGSGPNRAEALRGAFDRFLAIGRENDAARVAMELARSRAADQSLGEKLEPIAVKTKDLDALAAAHEILAKELSGNARSTEFVRQAEVMVQAGADPLEAMQHGESALASTPANEVEPLLSRLAALTAAPGHVVDLYERQVGRCKQPQDRLVALARAAQVASSRGAVDRAKSFLELALGGNAQEETLATLETFAAEADGTESNTVRALLADALASGGHGSRDGGRTRAALLRRAALIAERDLKDLDKAFAWIGDSVVTHVDDASLSALVELGTRTSDMKRVEATLGRALEEVFDGPLVRKLLARRARLRRDDLNDRQGAALDLKKLHDLSPSDQDVMNELSALLELLGDHRGMVHLYEDQILRGRDPALRAELARKVARLWEEEIGDAREAADSWRRVLRMKAADPEATAGLERAKTGNLKKAPPVYERSPSGATPNPIAPPSMPRPASRPPSDVRKTDPNLAAAQNLAETPIVPAAAPAPADNEELTPVPGAPAQGSAVLGPADPTPVPGHIQAIVDAPAEPVTTPPSHGDPNGTPPPMDAAYGARAGYPDPYAQQAYPQHAQPGHDPQAYGQPQQGYDPSAQQAQYPGYDASAYAQQPQQGYGPPNQAQPGYAQPGYAQPGYAQPGYAQGYAQHDPQQQYGQQPYDAAAYAAQQAQYAEHYAAQQAAQQGQQPGYAQHPGYAQQPDYGQGQPQQQWGQHPGYADPNAQQPPALPGSHAVDPNAAAGEANPDDVEDVDENELIEDAGHPPHDPNGQDPNRK